MNLEAEKRSLDAYSIVGKKEAYRAQLLRTTSPDTELPIALEDTYESIEDYIEKSKIDIYKPLMRLVDLIGATDTQKELLRNTVDGILRDKKMIVPYDNPENKNCVSYKTIEEKVGIKLNIEAIKLLVNFANTYLYNKVEDKEHSVIIATHRQPARAFFTYEGDPPKREKLSEREANKLQDTKKIYVAWRGNAKVYDGQKPEKIYDRFVDGRLLPSEEVTEEHLAAYEKLRDEKTIIDEPITDYKDLIRLIDEMEYGEDYLRFEYLLNTKILKALPNESKLSNEQIAYVEKFKKYAKMPRYALRYSLTPESLMKSYKEEKDLNPEQKEQKMETFLESVSKKIPELDECINDIMASFNSGSISNIPIKDIFSRNHQKQETLKERFEKILVQAIFDGQITDYDYFMCMKTMHCMLELNKVKLSPQATLDYVIESEGGKPDSNPKIKSERTK